MKLNFITDHGSILDTTSWASRDRAVSWLTFLGANWAAGRRCAPAWLWTVAVLPVSIVLPGLPVVLGRAFFLVPVANGAAILDRKPFDRTGTG
jgi:hypothetical protein